MFELGRAGWATTQHVAHSYMAHSLGHGFSSTSHPSLSSHLSTYPAPEGPACRESFAVIVLRTQERTVGINTAVAAAYDQPNNSVRVSPKRFKVERGTE
jgi:hypothetical protein